MIQQRNDLSKLNWSRKKKKKKPRISLSSCVLSNNSIRWIVIHVERQVGCGWSQNDDEFAVSRMDAGAHLHTIWIERRRLRWVANKGISGSEKWCDVKSAAQFRACN